MLHAALYVLATLAPQGDGVTYADDIAPIFEAHCLRCHGEKKPQAGLRLDSYAGVLAGSDNGEVAVIHPGESAGSRLYQLVSSTERKKRMPPKGRGLTADQLEALRRWIDEGAQGEVGRPDVGDKEHWAYVPPARSTPPEVGEGWARNDLDRFVLARMRNEGLEPAPEADAATLLRRMSLDLTGLPPTLAELDAFLADDSPQAYELALDRLLASPAYGERMARGWLDLARYADTNGFEKDDRRTMWRWRDWVIDAFNADMPFDQFTIEQLAGDLLNEPTPDQRIATGFHRNTMVNAEGGVDPEEYRVAAVVDRVNTTGSVWLGTTMGCAQCHTHKFDPVSHREYYRFFAYFNSTTDIGPTDQPRIEAPTPSQATELAERAREIAALEQKLSTWTPELEQELLSRATPDRGWTPLTPRHAESEAKAPITIREDASLLVGGDVVPTDVYRLQIELEPGEVRQLRLEVLEDPSLRASGPGRSGHGNFVLSELRARVARAGTDQDSVELAFTNARADFFQVDRPWRPEHTIDGDPATGWAIAGQLDASHQLVLTLAAPLVVRNGDVLELEIEQRYGGGHVIGCLRLSASALDADDVPLPRPDVEDWLRRRSSLDDEEREAVHGWFLGSAPSLEEDRARLAQLQNLPGASTALVMQERDEPRITHVLERGSFLSPTEVVEPGVPAVMGAPPADASPDRLGLARWLVDDSHPLTARVAVNRLWAQAFGRGLVTTEGDFGTQGAPPTHPALLDWLAREYVEGNWSTKSMLRTLMSSATYRQSSEVTPRIRSLDPDNRWLARGARFRVEAEMVRDVVLASAGLLERRVGGASVFPPQPAGVWKMAYSGDAWTETTDADRFRRGLYTFWRRTAPYPTFMAFDATSRELSCTRRERSNTPLQALALLNDPAFVEAAVALGARMMREADGDPRRIAARGFRLCTGREAESVELDVLVGLFEGEHAHFAADADAARALIEVPFPLDTDGFAPAELAAWTVVANVLLNLDETVTRS